MVSAPDIPGHKVGGVLGSGGFATVYRAWQIAVGREVAVKVDSRVLVTERDQRRFIREVTAAGRLSGHPHVIDVYDAGTLRDGRPFMVMELCPAGSLADAVRDKGPMSPGRVRDIGIRIADALAAAHAAGVLHRDIKPANILVNRYGMVGLSDFGLASITSGGEQSATREALTPAYASPESFRCEEPTATGDIYSLTATLYGLLAGRPPRFSAGSKPPSLATILSLHDRPVEDVPGVPAEMMALLRAGLSTDPAERPPSAAALRDALIALAGGPGAPAPPGTRRPEYQGRRRLGTDSQPSLPSGPGARRAAAAAPGWGHDGAGDVGDAGAGGPAPVRRLPNTALLAAVAVGLVLVVGAAAVLGAHILGRGAAAAHGGAPSHPKPPNVFGVATTTNHCPAASVPTVAARCPASPECWGGVVETAGDVTASPLPCTGPHVWQTFAIAILPANAQTFDEEILRNSPSVQALCSLQILLKSRRGPARRIPPREWMLQLMPPDEAAFNSGARAYRCLAHSLRSMTTRTIQFGA